MSDPQREGWIGWFIRNPVAANLLMVMILITGMVSLSGMRTEGFPALDPSQVSIVVPYDSGSAQQSESGVTVKIENVLNGTPGIKSVTSTSTATASTVLVTKTADADLAALLAAVKTRVDSLTLPEDAERPVITSENFVEGVADVEIYGGTDAATLSAIARDLRARLLLQPEIPAVGIFGELTPELVIEPREADLQRFGITLQMLSAQLQAFVLTADQGTLKSGSGQIVVATREASPDIAMVRDVPVSLGSSDSFLRLSDLADVRLAYPEPVQLFRFDGQPAIRLSVEMLGKADLIPAAEKTYEVVAEYQATQVLPENLSIKIWNDGSAFIADRLKTLLVNGAQGIALVLIALSLFLNFRVALWVAMGLPVCFAGSLILMGKNFADMTLNDLTTFGFIMALGIVVDDAIVVGESVQAQVQRRGFSRHGVFLGVNKVMVPTVFGILTSIAALFPILMVPGELAEIFAQFAAVMIFCLIFSMIESKLILPAHLAHEQAAGAGKGRGILGWLGRVPNAVSAGLRRFSRKVYEPFLRLALRLRYLTLAVMAAIFAGTIGLVMNQTVRVVFFPDIGQQTLKATYVAEPDFGPGPFQREAERIAAAAMALSADMAETRADGQSPIANVELNATGNRAEITVALNRELDEAIDGGAIIRAWEQRTGAVEGAQSLSFSNTFEGFPDFAVNLSVADSRAQLEVTRLALEQLRVLPGVDTASSDYSAAQAEIEIELNDLGRSLGFTAASVASQVNRLLDGDEIAEFIRNGREFKVRLIAPQSSRETVSDLKGAFVISPSGQRILLEAIAVLKPSYVATEIQRRNGKRIATVTVRLDKTVTSGPQIQQVFESSILPGLRQQFPDLSIEYAGELEQEAETLNGLAGAFGLALVAIYALLSIPLKSYTQPLIILSVVPFGVVGAILGHWFMGHPLSVLSAKGILALSGVVVNDSLLLVSTFNDQAGKPGRLISKAVRSASSRLRAVILTSTTTFIGLAPLLTETSEQAQILMPAAISLAFGILFSTIITLILVPALLMVRADLASLAGRLRAGLMAPGRQPQ